MSEPLFLAPAAALAVDTVVLDGSEGRHAARVRRLRPGEPVDLTDGAGLLVHGAVTAVGRDTVRVDVRFRVRVPPPTPRLVVVQALAKGDRAELAVAAMTEVGVDSIVPWPAARSVPVWRGERGAKSLARWRATAREAGKQARRAWLPEVTEPLDTADVAARLGATALPVVLHERADTPLPDLAGPIADVPPPGEVVLVVGPEGGLTDAEVERFAAAGARVCGLGPTVLRTSTAGVVAAGVVLATAGRWRPAGEDSPGR